MPDPTFSVRSLPISTLLGLVIGDVVAEAVTMSVAVPTPVSSWPTGWVW